MNNKSPFLLSEPRKCCSVTWALLVEVSNMVPWWIVLLPCSPAWFFFFLTNVPPHPHVLINDTLTYRQTVVSPTHPHGFSSLSPPLPTQPCDLTVSDNEVRILWLQSVRMTAVAGPCAACLVSGALCWLSAAPTGPGDGSLPGPPAMHFKVGDQGLTCAWHPENDNGSVSLHLLLRASLRNTKARRLLPQYCVAWRKDAFRKGGRAYI